MKKDISAWQAVPAFIPPKTQNTKQAGGGLLFAIGCLFMAGFLAGVGWSIYRRWFGSIAARYADIFGRTR